jgi:formylglycine-generating enzyme required for sulfatase activity
MQRLLLLVSLFLLAFAPMARTQQAAFYVNGATGVDSPSAGIPSAGPLGWNPNIPPLPQGWKTIQYAITQVQAWMAANSPTVSTAILYIQGGQNYSAATNGESFPVIVAPSILFEGTFIGQGFTAFPNLVPPAGVAAFSMPGNQEFLDRATISGVRYSNSLCRYIRFTGGSVGIAMGANGSFRHNPRIEDCDFVEQTVAGIRVDTTSGINDPKIYRNNFRGCARGVDMVARGVDPVLFADIEECSFESTASVVGGTGIYLLDQSTATGTSPLPSRVDGLFRSNNFDQIQAGIYIESTTGAKIRSPQVFRSRFANLVGNSIELKLAGCEGQDLTVTDSVMMRGNNGIKIWGASGGGASRWTLDNNTFYQCLNNGLEISVSGSGSATLSSQRQTVRECNLNGYLIQPSAPLAFSAVIERDRLLDNVRGVQFLGTATGSVAMRASMVCRSRIFFAVRCNAPALDMQLDGLTIADNNIGLDAIARGPGSSGSYLALGGNTTDVQGASLPPFTFCCFGGTTQPGVGNLNLVNAQFDRPFYKLLPSSPCIDAGSFDAVSGGTDYEGDSRTLCRVTGGPGRRDLGADEWSGPGSARPYGNVGFEKYNVFPRISSSTVVLRSPSIQPLEVALRDAVQPVFGTPGAGAVLFFGFEDINRSLPFDLAPLGWPGSYVQLDPATSMGFFGITQTGPQAGSTVASIPIAPGLAGVSVTMQWFVLMPPPSNVVASDGLRVTVGNYPGSGLPVPTNMVPVQAGSYTRGSVNGLPNETPPHQVTITRPFWIGKREVTQAEYQAVMGSNPSAFQGAAYPDAAQRPVESVSWAAAMQFCALLTQQQAASCAIPAGYVFRLPTEAEWEFACRAGTTTEWNVGAGLSCSQANFAGCNATNQTVAVGSYQGNAWGLQDMHGNVWEWCLDSDAQTSGPASQNYPSTAVVDPLVSAGAGKLVRGGTRTASAQFCRSAVRYTANTPTSEIGFRIVLAPTLP